MSLYPELAIVLATPGFDLRNWGTAFVWKWNPATESFARRVQATADRDLVDLNAQSITVEDGLDWLRAVLWRLPAYAGPVPVWTKRAIRQQGLKAADWGVSQRQFGRWHVQNAGDPLFLPF